MPSSKLKFGIFVFPGSNCDHDCYHAVKHLLMQDARFIWHSSPDVTGLDCLIIPGGFSYGDYLRPGAIAKLSPAVREITAFARRGGPVLGICNGFQILLESELLPGAMIRNRELKFICEDVFLKTGRPTTPFTSSLTRGQVIRVPIAHADGSYYADSDTLKRLEDEDSILFRYCDSNGAESTDINPNGSMNNIAGISNSEGNILGMMPHPERAVEPLIGGVDGRLIFESIKSIL